MNDCSKIQPRLSLPTCMLNVSGFNAAPRSRIEPWTSSLRALTTRLQQSIYHGRSLYQVCISRRSLTGQLSLYLNIFQSYAFGVCVCVLFILFVSFLFISLYQLSRNILFSPFKLENLHSKHKINFRYIIMSQYVCKK